VKIIIDPQNVLNFLEGKEKIIGTVLNANERFITIFDYSLLISGIFNTENQNHNLYIIKKFIKENFEILEFSRKEAEIFAKLKNRYNHVGELILLNSSIIINNKIKYFTTNLEKYNEIKELKKLILTV
jgi:predicted nucleic acid-binding protein